ncbi:hypothetical protein CPter291_0667 [Collimonas pratensis]|uniref:Uncharacterized protein n=1 Tax=Collimonas pratensis TaxID=279113 RepID=A0ABN4MBS5_9BURK|nr:hypothetical protein CPter291_0667 [Collimonas pratensis]
MLSKSSTVANIETQPPAGLAAAMRISFSVRCFLLHHVLCILLTIYTLLN